MWKQRRAETGCARVSASGFKRENTVGSYKVASTRKKLLGAPGVLKRKGANFRSDNEIAMRKRYITTTFRLLLTMAAAMLLTGHALASETETPDGGYAARLDGTMMPYDFSLTDSTVPWKGDMKPVFINYMARHGARFLSSEKKTAHIREVLLKARGEGDLTPAGEDFLRLVERVDSATAGRWGALDETGMEEEVRLATEMYAVAPELLRTGKVAAVATYVPRVVMTMYEFCHQLAVMSPDVEVATSEGKQYNSLLRYFKADSAYVDFLRNPEWRKAYDEMVARTVPTSPAALMFKGRKDAARLRELTLDAYGILQSLRATGVEGSPREWFTAEEYESCWKADNLEHYYARSASGYSMVPVRCAEPLLRDIISTTERAARGASDLSACLRFGHAETVLPLFSLMRLPGCYAPEADPESVAEVWVDSDISPLGANLMMVLLRGGDGKSYVALRLNGRWVDMPGGKVMEWSRLKELWEGYMDKN